MTINYTSVVCDKNRNEEWDDFVTSVSGSYFMQTSRWASVNIIMGWKANRFYLKNDREILAGAQIAFKEYPLIGRVGLIDQGPYLRNDDAELLKEYIFQLNKFLRKNRFLLVGVTIPYFNDHYIIELKKSGLVKNPFEIPPTIVIQSTLIIDLKKSKDELWADVNPGRRRNIKKGLKQKFVFRE